MAQAGSISQPSSGVLSDIFGPLGKILGKVFYIITVLLVISIIILAGFIGYRYFAAKQKTGELASTVKHAEVTTEEAARGPFAFVKSFSPDLYYALNPGEYNPYAIDTVVESSARRDIGVKISEFKPIADFYRQNSQIILLGEIQAEGLGDKPVELEVFCSLEDYEDGNLLPARLFGSGASGNHGIIYENQRTEFQVQCAFPQGLAVDKQVASKKAKLVVTYSFTTKAYQRVWFLEKSVLEDMQTKGIDPFEVYGVEDDLLGSDGKTRAVTTPGPINLGMSIDFPQPLSDDTQYLLLVNPSRSFDVGNLQTLNYLKIKLPAVPELELALAGEETLLGNAQCDFEYTGPAPEPGYKEYQLSAMELEETNKECNKKSLKDLALSEKACIEYYKEPTFFCDLVVKKAPSSLQSDTIRAEAGYVYKVEKQAVVDIKALPSEVA